MKKIFSLCAALALVLSLCGSALAAPEEVLPVPEESAGAEVPPVTEDEILPAPEEAAPVLEEAPVPCAAGPEESAPETISVILPTNPWVVVNPYGLRVSRDGVESNEQIVSPVQALVNCGAVPVRVEAGAVGVVPPESGVSLVTAPPSGYGRDVFLYVEFQPGPEQWTGWFSGGSNQLLVTAEGERKADVLTLDPNGEGYFRLSGGTSAPSEAWTPQDTVDVTLSFTFSPLYTASAPEAPLPEQTPVLPEPAPAPESPPEAEDQPEEPEVPEEPMEPAEPEIPEEEPEEPAPDSQDEAAGPETPPETDQETIQDGGGTPEEAGQPEEIPGEEPPQEGVPPEA